EVNRRKGSFDKACQSELRLSRRAVAGAARCGFLNRGDDTRVGVAGDQRTPGGEIVDVLVTVDIPDACALGSSNEPWRSANRLERAHRRIDATWQQGLRLGEQSGRARRAGVEGHA